VVNSAALENSFVYFITPDLPASQVIDLVDRCTKSGADIVQLRSKTLSRRELFSLAVTLAEMVKSRGKLFIVNDYLDIAMASGADGVHLGEEDIPVKYARKVWPDGIIGATAAAPDSALKAYKDGADYIGTGSVFASKNKPDRKVIGPLGVLRVMQRVPLPVFAIGGITLANVDKLLRYGIRRVAVISALSESNQVEDDTFALRWLVTSGLP